MLIITGKDMEILEFFENEPQYVQAHVTDCIVNTNNLTLARRLYEETVDYYMDAYCPEMMNDYYV